MAKQSGIIKIRGTVDNLTFLETKDGSQVRKKRREVSKEEFALSPSFARQRENISEFGRAIAASKLFRSMIGEVTANNSDKRLTNRMNRAFSKVVDSDPVNKRGQRTVLEGDMTLLKDFNFNPPSDLINAFRTPYTAVIDQPTGKMTVTIPSFIPENAVLPPAGSSHFMIHSLGLDLNFATEQFVTKSFVSPGIPLGTDPTPPVEFTLDLPANSTNPLFLLLGIRYYQEVNGVFYTLRNSAKNALAIVEVVDAQ